MLSGGSSFVVMTTGEWSGQRVLAGRSAAPANERANVYEQRLVRQDLDRAGSGFVCRRRSWQPENEDFTAVAGAKLRLRTGETKFTVSFVHASEFSIWAAAVRTASLVCKTELHSNAPHF